MSTAAPQLPVSMRAVGVKAPGGVDQLELIELPVPSPMPGEVLIQVKAAGVNRPDVLQRLGLYPPPADANPNLGLEVSGVVVAVGQGVPESHLGEPVMALCNGGGYAEYAYAFDRSLPNVSLTSNIDHSVDVRYRAPSFDKDFLLYGLGFNYLTANSKWNIFGDVAGNALNAEDYQMQLGLKYAF
mgnify:FL=1